MNDPEMSDPERGRHITLFSLLLNYIPFLYLLSGGYIAWAWIDPSWSWAFVILWIYFVPPIVCRLTLLFFARPEGRRIGQQSATYKTWWFLTQIQMLFNRLHFLEEMLRLVPGAYAVWLTLWGSKVSVLSFWGPQSKVFDRYLIQVERGAVVGSGVKLSSHLGLLDEDGGYVIDLALITISEGAIIGAEALIGPGCRVEAHEMVPASRKLQPYSTWRKGRKVKG